MQGSACAGLQKVTTKIASFPYVPEVSIEVPIINFTVTLPGLEDQPVADVIGVGRPDLAQQRKELVVQIAADKKAQDDLQTLILKLLAEACDSAAETGGPEARVLQVRQRQRLQSTPTSTPLLDL